MTVAADDCRGRGIVHDDDIIMASAPRYNARGLEWRLLGGWRGGRSGGRNVGLDGWVGR